MSLKIAKGVKIRFIHSGISIYPNLSEWLKLNNFFMKGDFWKTTKWVKSKRNVCLQTDLKRHAEINRFTKVILFRLEITVWIWLKSLSFSRYQSTNPYKIKCGNVPYKEKIFVIIISLKLWFFSAQKWSLANESDNASGGFVWFSGLWFWKLRIEFFCRWSFRHCLLEKNLLIWK